MYNKLIALALAFTACSSVATAPSTPPDWKLYAITARKPQVALFYLESETVRTPRGHVQLWMKAIDFAKLNKASDAITPNSDLMKKSVVKALEGYVPPLAIATKATQDQATGILQFELLADEGTIPPALRVLFEFDCPQKLYRQLSAIDERAHTDNLVHEWGHVPPESTYETLSGMVCPTK